MSTSTSDAPTLDISTRWTVDDLYSKRRARSEMAALILDIRFGRYSAASVHALAGFMYRGRTGAALLHAAAKNPKVERVTIDGVCADDLSIKLRNVELCMVGAVAGFLEISDVDSNSISLDGSVGHYVEILGDRLDLLMIVGEIGENLSVRAPTDVVTLSAEAVVRGDLSVSEPVRLAVILHGVIAGQVSLGEVCKLVAFTGNCGGDFLLQSVRESVGISGRIDGCLRLDGATERFRVAGRIGGELLLHGEITDVASIDDSALVEG